MTQTLADLDDEELPDLSPQAIAQLKQDIDSGLIAQGLDQIAVDSMARTGAGLADLGPRIIKFVNDTLDLPFDDQRKHYAAECRMKLGAATLALSALTKVDSDRLRAKSEGTTRDRILRIVAEEREKIKVIEAQVIHHHSPVVELDAALDPAADGAYRKPQ